MKNTIIILIVLAVMVLFYGQSFMPTTTPSTEVQNEMPAGDSIETLDGTLETVVNQ